MSFCKKYLFVFVVAFSFFSFGFVYGENLGVHDTYTPLIISHGEVAENQLVLSNVPPGSFSIATNDGRNILNINNHTTMSSFSLHGDNVSTMGNVSLFNISFEGSVSPSNADALVRVRNEDVEYSVYLDGILVDLDFPVSAQGDLEIPLKDNGDYEIRMKDRPPVLLSYRATNTSFRRPIELIFRATLNGAMLCSGDPLRNENVDLFFEFYNNNDPEHVNTTDGITLDSPGFFHAGNVSMYGSVGDTYTYSASATKSEETYHGNENSVVSGRGEGQFSLTHRGNKRFVDVLVTRIRKGFRDFRMENDE